MSRPGNQDRGLFLRRLPSGETRWYVQVYWQGREVKRAGGATKAQARRVLTHLLADLQRGALTLTPRHTDTLAAAIDRYRPLAQHLADYHKAQSFFTFWTTRLGHQPIQQLTPLDIQQAQSALFARGLSPARVNRYTDWLRHVLNIECKGGRLASNPATKITRAKEPPAPIHHYTAHQEAALMRALGPYALWVRFAILSALRQQEQFSIRKDWIHWEEGFIQIPKTKTTPRMVGLTTELAHITRTLADRHPESPWLFPSPKFPHRHIDPGNWYRRIFRPACVAAQLPTTLKWHTLRHTFGTRLAALGFSARQIREAGGWETDHAANRYIHLSHHHLLQVGETLSTINNTMSPHHHMTPEPEHQPEHGNRTHDQFSNILKYKAK